MPEHGARRVLVQVEQIQLATELAMIPLLSLFQHDQVLLKLILRGPGSAIDALQHFVAMVTSPIRPSDFHELEVLELAGAGHMRATTEVFEGALAVQRHILAARNAGDDLGLVVLTQSLEIRHRLVAREHTAHHCFVLVGQFDHLLFDSRKVFGREGPLVGKVVVETVLDHGTDGDLCVGKQFLDGVGQQMGGGVSDHLQAIGVLGSDNGQRSVFCDQETGVHQPAVDLATQRRLGQTGADGGGHLGHGHWPRELSRGTVRKCDVGHGVIREKKARTWPRFKREDCKKTAGANCWPQLAWAKSSGLVRGVITKQYEV